MTHACFFLETVHDSSITRVVRGLIVIVSLAIGVQTLWAQNPNLGTAGAQFLKIPAGARATALGGAYVALANDATALFWNPAGVVHVRANDLSFSHTAWWAGITLNHAAFVHTIEDVGTFGVSVAVLTMDKMEVTTELLPDGTGEFFDAQDLMLGLSYARRLTEDFSFGVTAKYVNQRIWNETATGFAFDVGTQYRIGFRDLTIAMSMSNFGGDMKYSGRDLRFKADKAPAVTYNRLTPSEFAAEDFPLPLHFQVGLAMTAFSTDDMQVRFGVDVTHPNDNNERVNVGGEIIVLNHVALRGGYRFGYDTDRATLGAGVVAPLGDVQLRFDYAYTTYSLLPNVNRFTLGVEF
jgi:hypothetical protein